MRTDIQISIRYGYKHWYSDGYKFENDNFIKSYENELNPIISCHPIHLQIFKFFNNAI